MKRYYYADSIEGFLASSDSTILGELTQSSEFAVEPTQRDAWLAQIAILKSTMTAFEGHVYFEYSIPRMGRRIDVVLLIGPVIFVLEFKVGEGSFTSSALDQVCDYCLDLKYFHETSHEPVVAPILVATEASSRIISVGTTPRDDQLLFPISVNAEQLEEAIRAVLEFVDGNDIDYAEWQQGRYSPTPTIVEAAMALYRGHAVGEISRSDAGAKNLTKTSEAVSTVIDRSKAKSQKAICFVTGVPGAGKTLVGLDIATKHIDKDSDSYSVFLSGNGPLVDVLREALVRDKVERERLVGRRCTKGQALAEVKTFIQNVHHFRDECLIDRDRAPREHVALFDEAQRAWDLQQTTNFMRRKKGIADFDVSEPAFLVSCLDRHSDWAVVVCLVGGGQEINTGEAGISEWLRALDLNYPDWKIYISPRLTDSEFNVSEQLVQPAFAGRVEYLEDLHLGVSMRSFRAENVSLFVRQMLDMEADAARETLQNLLRQYPIALTRDLGKAKHWLKYHARGSERYGIVVSSQAERLKPEAINVKAPMSHVHWFLGDKEDVRSAFYLEDVATEFHVQGLELDWACVTWDADFRYGSGRWANWSFKGNRWQRINKPELQNYQKNAYRVLLTRARQGMVIVVPEGNPDDHTRQPEYYDAVFEYLKRIGIPVI